MAEVVVEEYNDMCVCGFHVYQDVWRPVIGDNPRDPYAVVVIKSRAGIVGHVPHNLSALCSVFIRRSGAVYCIVTGTRQYSRDLPQGGMEIPCKYRFVSNGKDLKKFEAS